MFKYSSDGQQLIFIHSKHSDATVIGLMLVSFTLSVVFIPASSTSWQTLMITNHIMDFNISPPITRLPAGDVTAGLYILGVAHPGVFYELWYGVKWTNYVDVFWTRPSCINEWIRLVSAQYSVIPVRWWTRICLSRLRSALSLYRHKNRTGANVNKRKWSWRRWWPIRKLDDLTLKESFWERYFNLKNVISPHLIISVLW